VLGQKPQPVHLLLAQREVQLHAAVAAAAAAARVADAGVVVVPAVAAAVVAAVAAAVAALDLDGRLAQLTAQGEQLLFKLLQPLQRLLRSAHLRRSKGHTSVTNDRLKKPGSLQLFHG
jgi:hypothetical protein